MPKGTDAKYFSSTTKEDKELKDELNSLEKKKQQDAVSPPISHALGCIFLNTGLLFRPPFTHRTAFISVLQVKKVIALMTTGKDVSSFFVEVVKLMQTENIELKKLIYLYIINYAGSQQVATLLVVNGFTKDAKSPNPLIRALGEYAV